MTLFCRVKGGRAGAGKGGNFQVGEFGGSTGSGSSWYAREPGCPPDFLGFEVPQQFMCADLQAWACVLVL